MESMGNHKNESEPISPSRGESRAGQLAAVLPVLRYFSPEWSNLSRNFFESFSKEKHRLPHITSQSVVLREKEVAGVPTPRIFQCFRLGVHLLPGSARSMKYDNEKQYWT
ncbi:hypothetical protein GCK32_010250 [Trichostrongylus colubriformis]|uniref:Uncharacterized protein n=1 Tax=Trichostrongylus colubriformis TaxID=6319 RepID=A0AAN8FDP9_TRICO